MNSKPLELDPRWKRIVLLTPSEYAVFLLFGDGLTSRQVAKQRGCSIKTVETQYCQIKKKMRLPNVCALRALAVRFVLDNGRPKMVERVTERRLVLEAA